MQIRRAVALDEQTLARIRRDAILALAVPTLSIEQAEQWASQLAADRFTRAIRDHEVWIAEDAAALGWVEVAGDRIASLYVLPSAAGQGLGSALLAYAESAISGSGFTIAHLDASPNALAFYRKRGYQHCGPQAADSAWPLRKALADGDGSQRADL